MEQCQNCGNSVSDTFARVFSIDGELYACPDCTTRDMTAKVARNRMNM